VTGGRGTGGPARGYQRVVRPLLFRAGGGDPEAAHARTLRLLARVPPGVAAGLARRALAGGSPRTVFGVRFPNPVGLAAGMDKDGVALPAWPALGFGFVEVGTVTWHAQPGNPRPRLFRLPASQAVINRMGFNNAGAAALADRLAAGRARYGPPVVPLGINLGKSKVTPLAEAVGDYLASLELLYLYGDYFVVNVSSPNTPGLRSLQDAGRLGVLLAALQAHAAGRGGGPGGGPKPILVKIAPDLPELATAELLAVCAEHRVAGLVAGNTTTGRAGLAPADAGIDQPGGLSGAPLFALSRRVVEFVHRETAGRLPVIAVGGISSAEDAARMFDAGASLVQLYTGLVYHGPALVRAIARLELPGAPHQSTSGGPPGATRAAGRRGREAW
jgi:dihydroorotate dehydrogenase